MEGVSSEAPSFVVPGSENSMTAVNVAPKSDLGYTEGPATTGKKVLLSIDVEKGGDEYKSRERLEAENALLRERLERRGGTIQYLSNELSRAQEFGVYCAELSNQQAEIIEVVVTLLNTEIAGGKRPSGSRMRTRQILAEELIDAISNTDAYNADLPVLHEGEPTSHYINQE